MQPHEFLAAVLPSSGIYCEFTTKNKEHSFTDDVEKILSYAKKHSDAGFDSYFAVAAFKTSDSRLASNARAIRTLAIDVDAYDTLDDRHEALEAFLENTKLGQLGRPWIVQSGGGIHAYWPLEEDVSIQEWLPVAEALKRLARAHEFDIDMTVTADAARVLRVPGTLNYKYTPPAPVEIFAVGDTFNFIKLRDAIDAETPVSKPKGDIEGIAPKKSPTATQVKLMENSAVSFKDIMVKTMAGNGCAQLAYYVDHAHEDGMEPLWRGLLSIAKVCEDGEKAVQKLSALHPYTPERAAQKLREIKGPYPCVKFDSESPSVCGGCPHWGKITNPLALGRKTLVETAQREISIPALEAADGAHEKTVTRPEPPDGFYYGQHGGVYRQKRTDDPNDPPVTVLVLPYELFAVDLMHIEGVYSVHLLAMRPDGVKDITLPLKAVVAKDDCIKLLAQQNIISAAGPGNDKNLHEYVRGCTENASTSKKANTIPTQYGWQLDQSFVFDGKIYEKDNGTKITPMPGLENIVSSTKPKGSIENWRGFVNLLIKKELHAIIAHGCIGFGAPLMAFTGMRGLTFHAGHKQSGTGKSLALSMAASIWGHPVDYRCGKSSSPVAMQQRAGNLNSLPFVCDELTVKARADTEWFPSFVFDFSEGRGKERMEAGANRERVNTSTWSSLAFFTSNTRMLDYMTGVRQHSSEGELRRFLEWSPAEQLYFNEQDQGTLQSVQQNYGVAGEMYVRWLVDNREIAQRVVQEVKEKLGQDYKATNDERFWIAGVSAVVAGAVLAGKKYAGIVDLPVASIVKVFRGLINDARSAIKASAVSAEDVLNDFVREYYGQFVVVRKASGGGLLAQLGNGEVVDASISRTKIAGRVEHEFTAGWVDFYVEEQVMKRHCSAYSYGYTDFKRDISDKFRTKFVRKNMTSDTRAPHMRVNAIHIARPVREGEFDELTPE